MREFCPSRRAKPTGSLESCQGLHRSLGRCPQCRCQSAHSWDNHPLCLRARTANEGSAGSRHRGWSPTSRRGQLTAFSTEIEEAGQIPKGNPLSTGPTSSPPRGLYHSWGAPACPSTGQVLGGNDDTHPLNPSTGHWVGAPLSCTGNHRCTSRRAPPSPLVAWGAWDHPSVIPPSSGLLLFASSWLFFWERVLTMGGSVPSTSAAVGGPRTAGCRHLPPPMAGIPDDHCPVGPLRGLPVGRPWREPTGVGWDPPPETAVQGNPWAASQGGILYRPFFQGTAKPTRAP